MPRLSIQSFPHQTSVNTQVTTGNPVNHLSECRQERKWVSVQTVINLMRRMIIANNQSVSL